jgi:hypothetical protein
MRQIKRRIEDVLLKGIVFTIVTIIVVVLFLTRHINRKPRWQTLDNKKRTNRWK